MRLTSLGWTLWTTELPVDNGLACCRALATVAAMAKTRGLANQVDRNKDEQDALYDMHVQTHGWVRRIATVQKKHGQQLKAIETTQGEHSAKLDEILGILKEP